MFPGIPLVVLFLGPSTLESEVAKTRDPKPRVYHFFCDYMNLTPKGTVASVRRYEANYHTDEPAGRLRWTEAQLSSGSEGKLGTPKPLTFFEGFEYSWEDVKSMTKPEFFKSVPSGQVECRNLVWDTHMFEDYAHHYLAKMRMNTPVAIATNADSGLAGSGNFHNREIDLTWIGTSEWKGVPCALIRYRAFLNHFTYAMGSMAMDGTSDYWGEIWLAKKTNRIECATLYESVGVTTPQMKVPVRVFRVATFEHVK